MPSQKNASRHHRLRAFGPHARAVARRERASTASCSSGAAATMCSAACVPASSSKARSRSCAEPASRRASSAKASAPWRRDRGRRAALPHRLRGAERELDGVRPNGAHERSHGRARREWRAAASSRSTTSCSRTSTGDRPRVRYLRHGEPRTRSTATSSRAATASTASAAQSIPASVLKTHERVYPFGWLGVLADVPPVSPELDLSRATSAASRCAACARRRAAAATCNAISTPTRRVERRAFLGRARGAPAGRARGARRASARRSRRASRRLRSFVAEPLRYGRLFLAGDAAHIVPPTGAKGLNLAVRDVDQLAAALVAHYAERQRRRCSMRYSATALRRIWRAERFSAWLTSVLHRFPGRTSFDRGMQLAELDHLVSSAAARAAFVETYTGL